MFRNSACVFLWGVFVFLCVFLCLCMHICMYVCFWSCMFNASSVVVQIFQGPADLVLDLETSMAFQSSSVEAVLVPVTYQLIPQR